MPVIIKETIPGCGDQWYCDPIMERQDWLKEHLDENTYIVWYGGVKSDDRYTNFLNEEDALAYKFKWM